MKNIAIIAEFNPFHNGHEYLIKRAAELSKADNLIVIMSGDFVQRGEPAIWNKYIRAKAAILGGADIVLELPVCYSTGSAAVFSQGAVSLLNRLNSIDELWFGSEAADISVFDKISELLINESPSFKEALRSCLKAGMSFPKARETALLKDAELKAVFPDDDSFKSFFASPNNILGIEYCIALKKLKSPIKAKTLKRIGKGYNDTAIAEKLSSASSIRAAIEKSEYKLLPDNIPGFFYEAFDFLKLKKEYITADDLSLLLKYCILSKSEEELCEYPDINPDLAKRIKNLENEFIGFRQFIALLKSKSSTYSSLSRSLVHIVLDLKSSDVKDPLSLKCLRVLGFRQNSRVFSELSNNSSIVLSTRSSMLDKEEYAKDLFASNLYESIYSYKSGNEYIHDYRRKLIKI